MESSMQQLNNIMKDLRQFIVNNLPNPENVLPSLLMVYFKSG